MLIVIRATIAFIAALAMVAVAIAVVLAVAVLAVYEWSAERLRA